MRLPVCGRPGLLDGMERTKAALVSLSCRLRFHWREVLFALVLTIGAIAFLIAASFGASDAGGGREAALAGKKDKN
ncbi:MAG: hypothetical protein ACREC6_00570 [Hyphomicrobiaceae bacterium]